jgi:hypothetical protein
VGIPKGETYEGTHSFEHAKTYRTPSHNRRDVPTSVLSEKMSPRILQQRVVTASHRVKFSEFSSFLVMNFTVTEASVVVTTNGTNQAYGIMLYDRSPFLLDYRYWVRVGERFA